MYCKIENQLMRIYRNILRDLNLGLFEAIWSKIEEKKKVQKGLPESRLKIHILSVQ